MLNENMIISGEAQEEKEETETTSVHAGKDQ